MATAIKDFCERRGFNEVHGLLCHSGPPTDAQLLLAVMVLERLVSAEQGAAADARKELNAIRAAVDPLHKAERLRSSTERQEAEIANIEAAIEKMKEKNKKLIRLLEAEPARSREATPAGEYPDAQRVSYSDSDTEKTQEISD